MAAPLPRLALTALSAFFACAPGCAPPAAPEGGGAGRGESRPTLAMPADEDLIREAPGVELGQLSEVQRSSFFQVINTEPGPCDPKRSLAASVRDDKDCPAAVELAQFVADALAGGAVVSDVRDRVGDVAEALVPVEIPIAGRPTLGNESAPVTVVVFADFECPHCRVEAPVLRKAVQQFRGRAKLVFKHFPLKIHPKAFRAALACEAAHRQGKFWAMHDVVFEHQTALDDADLRRYARQVGLDMAQFEADFASEEVKRAVEADRDHGDKIEIPGTPAVYVNGRSFTPLLYGGTVEGWIDEALRRERE